MRITDLRIAAAELPLSKPLRTAIHEIRNVCCLLLTLETDTGLQGEGYGFAFNMDRLRSTIRFIESLRTHVVGRDPHDVEAIWSDLFRAFNFHGQAGVAILAVNPIDIACWDIVGKAAGRPLFKLRTGIVCRCTRVAACGCPQILKSLLMRHANFWHKDLRP